MPEATKRTVSDLEMELRRKLAIMCRIVGMQGSIGLYGHLSIRVPDTDLVLMTPGAGSRKTRVRTDQIFVFDLAGKIHYHPGGDRPMQIPIEWRIHTQIHKDRPEILSVAHLHAHASTLMGIAGRDIVPVFSQGWVAHDGIPSWEYPGLVLNDDHAAALSKVLGKHVACQMRGHGSVVVGETAELCFQNCTFIEENAQYQIEAEALGGAKPFAPEIWAQIAAQRRSGTGGTQLLWRYWEQIVEEQGLPL
ncbi:MAG TPA: class II aldolase/adducin family protein [Stellaceae bacterium]|nr:class II aldolase/adducin family protein [Stellaceae bacterium]